MSMKIHTVEDFFGFGLSTVESTLHSFALDELNGPFTVKVHNPGTVNTTIKVQQSNTGVSFADCTDFNSQAVDFTVVPGGLVERSGIAGGRYVRIVGSCASVADAPVYVWLSRPGTARDALSTRSK